MRRVFYPCAVGHLAFVILQSFPKILDKVFESGIFVYASCFHFHGHILKRIYLKAPIIISTIWYFYDAIAPNIPPDGAPLVGSLCLQYLSMILQNIGSGFCN
jgi:hypothetical protein